MPEGSIDLVLRRLEQFDCDPRPVGGDATWQARCPVHGGPYYALRVSGGQDGSVSLRCRYVTHNGTSCAESDVWEAIGLEPGQFAATPRAVTLP